MSRSAACSAASLLLVLACAGTALADDPPSHVAPFLGDTDDNVHTVTGAFGPAKDTTVVVSFNFKGAGSFHGFALVPDAKAKNGHRKLTLPKLPAGSLDGELKLPLTANLDKDDADELVIELHVQASVGSPNGGSSYATYAYVVLDWDGKQFVRVAALEKKLAAKMESRAQNKTDALAEADIRAALGVSKKP